MKIKKPFGWNLHGSWLLTEVYHTCHCTRLNDDLRIPLKLTTCSGGY